MNTRKLLNIAIAAGIVLGSAELVNMGIKEYQYYKQSRLRLEPIALFYHYTQNNQILNRVIKLDDKKNLNLFRKMPQFQEVGGAYGDFDNDGDLDFIIKSIFGTVYFENINDDKNPKYRDRGIICSNSAKLEDIISKIKSLKKE